MAGDVRWSSAVSAMVATSRPDRSGASPGVAGEDVAGERRLGEPGLLRELVVELALAPSRVPGEHADAGHVAAHVLDVVRHLDRRDRAAHGLLAHRPGVLGE